MDPNHIAPSNMRRISFSLKELLFSAALIALGLGMLVVPYRVMNSRWLVGNSLEVFVLFFSMLSYFCSGPVIGVGIFSPFKKRRIGFYLGVLAASLFFVYFLLHFWG